VATILIADDEANLRKVLSALLRQDGHTPLTAPDGVSALALLDQEEVDVVVTDLRMPGMTGLELLARSRERDPSLPIIVITAHGTVDTAVSALKSGAFDYVTKPFDRDELRMVIRKAVAARESDRDSLHPTRDSAARRRIIGDSMAMQQVFGVIEKVANTPSTVLITGESGTGKELVASALHEGSSRHEHPFIKVNCAAIPKELLESEFFGYEQGAFTGAVSAKPGRFELADQGTLFLDEIGEIPSEMQVKLLRALQESEFERVGGTKTLKVDVRLVAATNRDLEQEIANGTFREDLYYRLNVVPIRLPPLRERIEDIPPLAHFFLQKYSERLARETTTLSPQAMEALQAYRWPGNIRELENVIERTLLFADGEAITLADLPPQLSDLPPRKIQAPDRSDASMKDIVRQAASELERDLIHQALQETNGNVTRAAEKLRISRKGLQNKMKELGLRDDNETKP
jgi:nitrogen regulation protein NR(I)